MEGGLLLGGLLVLIIPTQRDLKIRKSCSWLKIYLDEHNVGF